MQNILQDLIAQVKGKIHISKKNVGSPNFHRIGSFNEASSTNNNKAFMLLVIGSPKRMSTIHMF